MEKMEKFLDIVYTNQIADSADGDKYEEMFAPLLERLQGLLSKKLYDELQEIFNNCAVQNNRFYAFPV